MGVRMLGSRFFFPLFFSVNRHSSYLFSVEHNRTMYSLSWQRYKRLNKPKGLHQEKESGGTPKRERERRDVIGIGIVGLVQEKERK